MSWNAARYRIVRHHLTNRCMGGSDGESNRLRMKEYKEKLLHHYFGNLSWEEIGDILEKIFGFRDERAIEVVRRVSKLKGRSLRGWRRNALPAS